MASSTLSASSANIAISGFLEDGREGGELVWKGGKRREGELGLDEFPPLCSPPEKLT